MKRKYYLRGLGIGILVTALVFAFVGPEEMTDAEIIEKAEALGYVKAEEEATPAISLKDLMETGTPTPSPVPQETVVPTIIVTPEADITEVPKETITPEPTEELPPTQTPLPTATAVPTQTPVPTAELTPTPTAVIIPEPTTAPENSVITATISVEPGNTAAMVCAKIQAAGIVADGGDLTNYLVWNGFADYINIGTYSLSGDMSYEEIAKILTGR